MSAWSVAPLGAESWAPSDRLRRPPSWFHGAAAELVPLEALARISTAASPLPAELPLVTPGDVNLTTGAVEPASVADGRDGLRLGEDLRAGDVLVPRRGLGPAVLVEDDHAGLGFGGFVLVRAKPEVSPHTLWALLTSESGREARRALETQGNAGIASSLPRMLVPRLPSEVEARVRGIRAAAFDQSALSTLDRSSRWRIVSLPPGAPWRMPHEPQLVPDGKALSDLGELWTGRVSPRESFAVPAPGRVPLLTAREFAPAPCPSSWVEAARTTTDSTMVIDSSQPFRVLPPFPGYALANGLLALDVRASFGELTPPLLARALTRFFGARTGRQRLAACSTGMNVRRIDLEALGKVLVSFDEVVAAVATENDEHLAERIESAFREALGA